MLAAEFLILALETVRELTTFVVTRYWISAKKWEAAEGKCRIVFLSDLHNRMYGKNNDRGDCKTEAGYYTGRRGYAGGKERA